MRARAALTAMVIASLAVACGGGKDEGRSPTTAARSAREIAADSLVAQRAVLRQADLPPGWTATPHDESPDDPDLERRLAACLQVDPVDLADNPSSVDSPQFELEPARQDVHNSVGLLQTVEEARERFALFERPQMTECLSTVVSEMIRERIEHPEQGAPPPAGVTIGQVSTQPAEFPVVGADTVAYQVSFPIEAAGQEAAFYATYVVAIKGRAGTQLTFLSLGEPFPAGLAQSLVQAVVDRIPVG